MFRVLHSGISKAPSHSRYSAHADRSQFLCEQIRPFRAFRSYHEDHFDHRDFISHEIEPSRIPYRYRQKSREDYYLDRAYRN